MLLVRGGGGEGRRETGGGWVRRDERWLKRRAMVVVGRRRLWGEGEEGISLLEKGGGGVIIIIIYSLLKKNVYKIILNYLPHLHDNLQIYKFYKKLTSKHWSPPTEVTSSCFLIYWLLIETWSVNDFVNILFESTVVAAAKWVYKYVAKVRYIVLKLKPREKAIPASSLQLCSVPLEIGVVKNISSNFILNQDYKNLLTFILVANPWVTQTQRRKLGGLLLHENS